MENAPSPQAAREGRIDAVDWLRGLAVVLMIRTHLYDAWASPATQAADPYFLSRYLDGIPSRLFLFLVGVSMAIRFQAQIAKGVDRAKIVRGAIRRGLQILGLAYLFRIQEYVLGGMGRNWSELFRVDILNGIGASMIVTAVVAAPRNGPPPVAIPLIAAALFVGLGPIIGPAQFPGFLPRAVTSYIGGVSATGWFPLFPWAAWPLIGVVVGHTWIRYGRDPRRQAIAFLITGVAGAAVAGAVVLIRHVDPHIIRYPSDFVQQMGPGTYFHQLGLVGLLALLAFLVNHLTSRCRFSVMRQLGRTSLLVYFVHVELCYGLLFRRLHHRLSFGSATIAFFLMTAVMMLLSVVKTKYWRGWPRRRRAGESGP